MDSDVIEVLQSVDESPCGPSVGGYRHEALLFRGLDELLAGTVPFVLDGLARSEPVMVAMVSARMSPLRDALGVDARLVHFVDMEKLGANPARILPAWHQFVSERAGAAGSVRGIGEPIWPGRRQVEIDECRLHEALLDAAVPADTPLWLRCPYDLDGLPRDVIDRALQTHQHVTSSAQRLDLGDTSCVAGPPRAAAAAFAERLPEPSVLAVEPLWFGSGALGQVRDTVRSTASSAGLAQRVVEDLVLGVHEVAVNSVVHGDGAGQLRIWRDGDALVCEVGGVGRILDSLIGRVRPGTSAESGRGLWMANQLCDLVQVRSGSWGSTVRILTWLT